MTAPRVVVNGVAAVVSNRTFMATGVELAPGVNTITAVGTDSVGNSDSARITVLRETAAGLRIEVVSGDQQAAGIGEALAQALVVAVRDQAGQGVAGRTVIFRVTQNSGTLLDAEAHPVRALIATTDAEGRAQARFQLGSPGVGNNRVEATSLGIPGAAVFVATGTSHGPAKINVDSGNNQKGVVRQALPRPFVAVVTDEGHNRLKGVQVTFAVVAGGGDFSGQESTTVTTDSDGRALAVLALGVTPGIENNVVTAAVANLSGLPAAFTASGYEPGDPAQTRISGVVLDNTNLPVPRVTLRVRQTALSAQTDEAGQFAITGAPVGEVHLLVDGSTAQRPGRWPDLEYEMVTVPGANNTLGMPIYLLPLDLANSIFVDETHGGTLTLPDYPGFSLTVAPNSARFPDGTRRGTISVTPVHVDKVPMVPNFGQQPRFIVTIQPPGVRFEPPAQVTHPNVDGLAPGEITEIYSFDHDMGSFVATGTATISEDGLVLRSDPGTGILRGGWHCGGNPASAGTVADCKECEICNGITCVPDFRLDARPCDNATKICKSGKCVPLEVKVQGADVTVDTINVALSPNDVSGTLTVELLGASANHTIERTVRAGGSYTLSFNIPALRPGEYTSVKATWDVNGVQADDELPYHIQVLGPYRHSQYNIPEEVTCGGPATPAYLTDGACTFTPTTLRGQFVSQANENGRGVSINHGRIGREFNCLASANAPPDARDVSFRLGANGNGACGPLGSNTVAVLPGHPFLGCGDRVFIHTVGIKLITDLCPDCAETQLDNFTQDPACAGILDLGNFMTIKLF